MFEIRWTIFLEVKNEHKAEKILKKIEAALGRTLVILESQKYWKIDNYWKIRFTTDLDADNFPLAVFEILQLCNAFSSNWGITTPETFENEQVGFTGVCNENLRIVGLKMADFYMTTK